MDIFQEDKYWHYQTTLIHKHIYILPLYIIRLTPFRAECEAQKLSMERIHKKEP